MPAVRRHILKELSEFRKGHAGRYWRAAFGEQLLGRAPNAKEKKLFSALAGWATRGKEPGLAKSKRTPRVTSLGASKRMQPVRDSMKEWFARIRGSVKGRFPKKLLFLQANRFKDQYIAHCLANNIVPNVCEVRHRWVDELIKENHVPSPCPLLETAIPSHEFWCRAPCAQRT